MPGSVETETFDRQVADAAIELGSFGLTYNQARVYLYLLSNGSSQARTISKSLGLHRVDVYRKIHELEELGMLEQYLDSPKRYVAVSPTNALTALLNRQKEKVVLMRKRAIEVVPRLATLQRSAPEKESGGLEPSYRLGAGRARYHNELKGLMRNAKHEVMRILSAEGIVRNFQSGFYNEYSKAASRGISLRMITEVNRENRALVKRLDKFIQIRYLEGIRLRFTVIDKSVTVFGTSYKPAFNGLEQNSYLVFKDPKFASVFAFFFDHLWEIASPRPSRTPQHEAAGPPAGVGNTPLHTAV